jgi:hypothetical protein
VAPLSVTAGSLAVPYSGAVADDTRGSTMALADKIKGFIRSPQGKQAMERGRQELSKPETQRKLKKLLGRRK